MDFGLMSQAKEGVILPGRDSFDLVMDGEVESSNVDWRKYEMTEVQGIKKPTEENPST